MLTIARTCRDELTPSGASGTFRPMVDAIVTEGLRKVYPGANGRRRLPSMPSRLPPPVAMAPAPSGGGPIIALDGSISR